MKIVSRNVNGLHNFVKHGMLDALMQEDADVYCLQEVKCQTKYEVYNLLKDALVDYVAYININTFNKRRYAGVITLVRRSIDKRITSEDCDPLSINIGMFEKERGRAIMLSFDFDKLIVINTCAPDERFYRHRGTYDRNLKQYVGFYGKKKYNTVVCGVGQIELEDEDARDKVHWIKEGDYSIHL